MASFHRSANLRPPQPTIASTVLSATSSLSSGICVESHPSLGKWWCRNYGIGPRKDVKFLTRRSSEENRHTSVKFRTASGSVPIADLNFSSGGALVVASGPRVSLYGGPNRAAGTSDFSRALRAGSAAQRRRDQDDDEGSVDLFGGKSKEDDAKDADSSSDYFDDIDADRNISTGGLLAECAKHRSDGKLIAVGTEGGFVKICDANSRAMLRTFKSSRQSGGGDRKAIRSVAWLRDGKRVVAAGDDGVVRVWNISGGMDGGMGNRDGAEITLRGHGDRVTDVVVVSFKREDRQENKPKDNKRSRNLSSINEDVFSSSTWSELIVSASYDHTIRIWDIESPSNRGDDRCVSIMNHGDPVQALLFLSPVGGDRSRSKKVSKLNNMPLLASAGGTTLKVWNPLNGSCLGTYSTKHTKTITSLCLLDIPFDVSERDGDESNTRKRHLVTGGLDGLLRIHSMSNEDIVSGSLPFLHGMQLNEPISALALSRDMLRLAIGMTTGAVMVHQRRRLTSKKWTEKKRKEPRHGTYSYFMRGAHEKTHDPDDYLLPRQKKQRLAEYDVFLRKFRYTDALDAALKKRHPQAVITVIEELGKRRGLTVALSNRDEDSLDAVLSFTIRFIDNPQYMPYLIGVANILLDIYGSLWGQSAAVDELFTKLHKKVSNECSVQKTLLRLLGHIDYVMAAAEISGVES